MSLFSKATRKKAKLRLALCGTSGSGKTYSALLLAKGLGGEIALIDTENGSGSLYEHLCDYDVAEIRPPFTVDKYIAAIKEAEKEGYNVLIIDSLSHAWAGQGGILEELDKRKSSSNSKNSFTAWRDVTPMHNKLVDTILQVQLHVIVTMRTKTAYEMERSENGKVMPVKMGMAPVQRDGLEYEFTVVLDMDNIKHTATAGKDRTGLFDGKVFTPDEETGRTIFDWLDKGIDEPVSNEMRSQILTESKAKGLQSADISAIIKRKYNVQSSKELTMGQAAELKNNLEKFWEELIVLRSETSQNPDDDAALELALNEAISSQE